MNRDDFVFFWRTEHPFSQWHPCQMRIRGIDFNCCEQWMMYSKAVLFKDFRTAAKILEEEDPRDQKSLGRVVSGFDKEYWNAYARHIVYHGNYAKFTQNKDFLIELKNTKQRRIVEASPSDKIWGVGLAEEDDRILNPDLWPGTNWLGIAIEQVRERLTQEKVFDLV